MNKQRGQKCLCMTFHAILRTISKCRFRVIFLLKHSVWIIFYAFQRKWLGHRLIITEVAKSVPNLLFCARFPSIPRFFLLSIVSAFMRYVPMSYVSVFFPLFICLPVLSVRKKGHFCKWLKKIEITSQLSWHPLVRYNWLSNRITWNLNEVPLTPWRGHQLPNCSNPRSVSY